MAPPDNPAHYRAAQRGDLAAETLTTNDRAHLLWAMYGAGNSIEHIARHTRTTTYTTDRIIRRIGREKADDHLAAVAHEHRWEGVA